MSLFLEVCGYGVRYFKVSDGNLVYPTVKRVSLYIVDVLFVE